jgi:hypothetical protein
LGSGSIEGQDLMRPTFRRLPAEKALDEPAQAEPREEGVEGHAQEANPGNETQAAVQLRGSCGGERAVFLPGRVNRESLVVAARLAGEE